mmetsp:Transcript_10595/g.18588  ORF Transcript_10595/g.18588 Transcript_10595/m.18588 type:complete len:280 (-) Transcript_10595:425-1264(-)
MMRRSRRIYYHRQILLDEPKIKIHRDHASLLRTHVVGWTVGDVHQHHRPNKAFLGRGNACSGPSVARGNYEAQQPVAKSLALRIKVNVGWGREHLQDLGGGLGHGRDKVSQNAPVPVASGGLGRGSGVGSFRWSRSEILFELLINHSAFARVTIVPAQIFEAGAVDVRGPIVAADFFGEGVGGIVEVGVLAAISLQVHKRCAAVGRVLHLLDEVHHLGDVEFAIDRKGYLLPRVRQALARVLRSAGEAGLWREPRVAVADVVDPALGAADRVRRDADVP